MPGNSNTITVFSSVYFFQSIRISLPRDGQTDGLQHCSLSWARGTIITVVVVVVVTDGLWDLPQRLRDLYAFANSVNAVLHRIVIYQLDVTHMLLRYEHDVCPSVSIYGYFQVLSAGLA